MALLELFRVRRSAECDMVINNLKGDIQRLRDELTHERAELRAQTARLHRAMRTITSLSEKIDFPMNDQHRIYMKDELLWYRRTVRELCREWLSKTASSEEGSFEIRRTDDVRKGHFKAIKLLSSLDKGYRFRER